jgi:TPR repeat protein
VIGIAAVACGGKSAEQIERAHAYERGTGVGRDYRAAAELYRAACDDGRGNIAACGALIRAGMRSRGTDFNNVALQALATKICVDRRDVFCCVAADMLSGNERDIPEPVMAVIKDVITNLPECDAAHQSVCEARLLVGGLDFSDGTTAELRRAELDDQLCSVGIVEGCRAVVQSSHQSAQKVADARLRLTAACDAGDADACIASPDRKPIPLKELCAANDYKACAAAGCRGDAQATKLAASHGVVVGDCDWLVRQYEPKASP